MDLTLIDTSVAVALVVAGHEAHQSTTAALADHDLALAGHAFFETYSVLTRLPPPARRSPAEVGRILMRNFPQTRFLTDEETETVARRLGALGLAGGSVYDALVGAVAVHHGLRLVSRDARAAGVYGALGADFDVID